MTSVAFSVLRTFQCTCRCCKSIEPYSKMSISFKVWGQCLCSGIYLKWNPEACVLAPKLLLNLFCDVPQIFSPSRASMPDWSQFRCSALFLPHPQVKHTCSICDTGATQLGWDTLARRLEKARESTGSSPAKATAGRTPNSINLRQANF